MTSAAGLAAQFTELMLTVLLAPLLTGWVNQCQAWLQKPADPRGDPAGDPDRLYGFR